MDRRALPRRRRRRPCRRGRWCAWVYCRAEKPNPPQRHVGRNDKLQMTNVGRRRGLSDRGLFCGGEGLRGPEQLVEECSYAFLVAFVLRGAVVGEALVHFRDGESHRNGVAAEREHYKPQLREAVDAAESARRDRDDAEGFALVLREEIIERVLED